LYACREAINVDEKQYRRKLNVQRKALLFDLKESEPSRKFV
jgi:hypothetical protein